MEQIKTSIVLSFDLGDLDMRGFAAFYAKTHARLHAMSGSRVVIITFTAFVLFVIFAVLFLLACTLGALLPAVAFFFCFTVAGIWIVIGADVAEKKMNEPRRYEYLGDPRKAVGREFGI